MDDDSIFIQNINDHNDLSIRSALKTYNSSKGVIYIVSKSEPLKGISTHVKEILTKYKSQKLR